MNTKRLLLVIVALTLAVGSTGGAWSNASAATCTRYHTVVPGEYLVVIARLYDTTWRRLADINNLSNPSLIYPGQRLCVAMEGEPEPTPPAKSPIFTITNVVADQTVTIKTSDFPARDNFDVLMGPVSTQGKDGIKAGTINSGLGGSFSATFRIPAQLKGMARIALRLQSPTSGYFSYSAFDNKSSAAPTPVVSRCDWVQFVRDVSVPDGAAYAPGTSFTKTWRLKNIGTCTWNSSYALVFESKDAMSGLASVALPGTVRPGETVDVSVNLVAPQNPGDYQGFWKLRSAAGVLFGIGQDANKAFWVKIKVNPPAQVVYDFTANYCSAEWRSGAGALACPDPSANLETGFINKQNNPRIENGEVDDEPALLTHPNKGEAGMISGRFPAFQVRSGDHFKTVLGCMYESASCNVMFQLNYRVDSGAIQNLRTWTEVYDRSVTKVDVDLTPLAGKSVEFFLTVLNNGNSDQDLGFWLLPRIIR